LDTRRDHLTRPAASSVNFVLKSMAYAVVRT
jgi:hypothetical protein